MAAAAIAGTFLSVSGLRAFRASGGVREGAGFADTLRAVPLRLVIGLDLLDLGLDILAAPLAWLLLDRAGLKSLRNVAAVEAIVPFTQAIPLLTLSWLGVRISDSLAAPGAHATPHATLAPGRKHVTNTAKT